MFSEESYAGAAAKIGCSVEMVKAVAEVESNGQTFWDIDGKQLPATRLESHWFGKISNYKFNESRPDLSTVKWVPELANVNQDQAYQRFWDAQKLDESAAIQGSSWGGFQVMGFHWKRLGYASPQDFLAAMQTADGQLDVFVRYIMADPALVSAMVREDTDTVAALYNGIGNVPTYSNRIRRALDRLRA